MERMKLTNLKYGISQQYKKGFIRSNDQEISENSRDHDLCIGHSHQDKQTVKKAKEGRLTEYPKLRWEVEETLKLPL